MAKRQTHSVFVRVSNVNDFIYVIKLQSFISDYRPSCMHCFELQFNSIQNSLFSTQHIVNTTMFSCM